MASWAWWRRARAMRQPLRADIDLLGQKNTQFTPPSNLGLNLAKAGPAWSVQRLNALVRQLSDQPTRETVLELRYGRHCLSRFWLEAPVDALPELWRGPMGDLSRKLTSSLLTVQPLSRDEERWSQGLLRSLASDGNQPARWNTLLALLPFLRPQDQLPCADEELPGWLRNLGYRCRESASTPRGLLNPAPQVEAELNEPDPSESRTPLPRLIETDFTTLLEQLNNQETLQRGKGLLRLHVIDPDDQDILEELLALRQAFAQLLLDLNSDDLESLYRSSLGSLYQDFVRADLPWRPIDQEHQAQLTQLLLQDHTGHDDGLLMAIMLYLPPDSIELNLESFSFPEWMIGVWRELSGDTPAT